MANKKWEESLAALGAKIDALGDKAKATADDAKAARELAKESVTDKIDEAKGDLIAAQERYYEEAERRKSKATSEMLKTQMTIKAKIQDKKDAHDKAKLEAYIDDMLEYASECYEAAIILLEDTKLATFEAMAAADEYEERFGEME